ncbi:MAG: zinc ribbon domain-containing protein [Promethearchaeota archaeon]
MLKKYTWLFPFIGGIISIIGLLTPIATFYNYFNIWMWGLVVSRLYGISVEFINDMLIINLGIISSTIIFLISLSLIITGYLYKRGYFDDKKLSKLWVISGIIIMSVAIMQIVALDFYTYEGNFPSGIWLICDPGFGAVGPILGGVLNIGIGIMVSSSIAGRKQRSIPLSVVAPKGICPYCGKPISLNASFCSKCGKTIED